MFRKRIQLSLISTFLVLSACSGGGGGTTTTLVQPTARPVAPGFILTTPTPDPGYAEPLTDGYNPNPSVQFASYNKILRALATDSYDYVLKEYDAGGLKLTAVKAENDFADYPVNYSIIALLQGSGQVGLRNKLVIDVSNSQKKNIIDKTLKHILIYGARFSANRLMDFNRTSAASQNPKYTTELASNAGIYFYGTENASIAENSIAQMSQKIDSDNAASTYNTIANGIQQLQKSASGDYKGTVDGRNMVEKGLLKMLYIATLEKAAVAIPAKNADGLDDAELYYIGIKEQVKTLDNIKVTKIESLLGGRDFRELDYPTFQKYLNIGFHEKAINEMQNAISRIAVDQVGAQNSAFNAQLYMDIINSPYENVKFKREENLILKENLINFVAAIAGQNKELAEVSLKEVINQSRSLI